MLTSLSAFYVIRGNTSNFFHVRDFPLSTSEKLPQKNRILYFLLHTHAETFPKKITFLTSLYAHVREKWRVKSVIFLDFLHVLVTRSEI